MQQVLPFDDFLERTSDDCHGRSVVAAGGPVPTLVVARTPPVGDAPVEFYFVRHRRARRYLLRVEPDGRVRVTIPRGGSQRQAGAFAQRNLEWIHAQRAQIVHAGPSAEERRQRRQQARRELPPRLMELAAQHGLAVNGVSIRNQRSRWGSCGPDGRISLNWRLVLMPAWVRDYVLIHELMHLRRMDHSPRYWAFVAQAYPDYRTARQWLRANGPSLR